MTAHWGIEDPSHVEGTDIERERAFVTALRYLENRIDQFTALPIERLEERTLAAKLKDIGRTEGASAQRLEDAQ
jgi:arsenate reductase